MSLNDWVASNVCPIGHAEVGVRQADVEIFEPAAEALGEGVLKAAADGPAIDPLAVALPGCTMTAPNSMSTAAKPPVT